MNYGKPMAAKPLRGPCQCPVKPWDANRKKTTDSSCHSTTTPYTKVYAILQCHYDIHVYRVIVTHETSSTMRGAIHGMQSTMELRPSCWIVAANDMSRPLRRATYGMQNAMEL